MFLNNFKSDFESPSLLELLEFGNESNLRYCFMKNNSEESPVHKWYAIGRHEKKKTCSLESFAADVDDNPNSHIYFSPNEFFSWRNKKQTSFLQANFIDIDTIGHEILTKEQEEIILNEVFEQIIESGIPWPTGYVQTGSGGLHLYWVYDKIPAYKYNVEAWIEVTKNICSNLKGGDLWKVDLDPSIDVSRVLRLPGSYHPKSGRKVEDHIIISEKYAFSDLLKSFKVTPNSNVFYIVNKANSKQKTTNSEQKAVIGKHNIKAWWFSIYLSIANKGRSLKDGFKEGQRDYAAFMLFIALKHIKGCPTQAFDVISDLNDEFIHLSKEELSSYLETAKHTDYRYRKDTIADYLERNLAIDTAFLFQVNKVRLSPIERKCNQSKGAIKAAMVKRERSITIINAAVSNCRRKGIKPTQKLLAELTNKSIRTIRRYKNDIIKTDADIRLASI